MNAENMLDNAGPPPTSRKAAIYKTLFFAYCVLFWVVAIMCALIYSGILYRLTGIIWFRCF